MLNRMLFSSEEYIFNISLCYCCIPVFMAMGWGFFASYLKIAHSIHAVSWKVLKSFCNKIQFKCLSRQVYNGPNLPETKKECFYVNFKLHIITFT